MPNTDDLYEALSEAPAALKLLAAALEGDTNQPLTVIAGQGRGSRKPPAELASVGGGS